MTDKVRAYPGAEDTRQDSREGMQLHSGFCLRGERADGGRGCQGLPHKGLSDKAQADAEETWDKDSGGLKNEKHNAEYSAKVLRADSQWQKDYRSAKNKT